MKKTLLLLAALFVACTGIFAQVTVSGDITTNTTWSKNNTYLLSGFVYVKNGATLTIEAGTTIKGDKITKGALIVTRGSKIIAEGTAAEPIVFTSNEASPTYGDWGGVIILGNGTTNNSFQGTAGCGEIEGGVNNANGDGLYGGGCGGGTPNATDNSGTLKYVRIEYPGIAFQPNNEINGLTLGGVGSGTIIDNVQVSYSGDDSFEWFGGSVNCKHLIAYRGLDDDFDADFGYNGNIQFAYAQRDPEVADVSGSNGFEVDNNATGTAATPKTRPTFSNVTIAGPSGSVAADYKRANHLRRNSESGVFNSVFVGAYPVGLFIDGDSCAQNAINGKLVVKNSFYHGMATPLSTNGTGFDINAYASANQVSTGTNAADAQLADPFNLNIPDPRPLGNSPVLGAAVFSDARLGGGFFTPVSYAGAFGPSGDWTASWSRFGDNLQQVGLAPTPEVVVSTNITTNTTWTADKVYVLQGFVYVKNCATLTIEPGTVIKGDKGTKGALIVTRCSKIEAEGTADLPIVFTTNDPEPTYGSWGGLILLGNGTTNTSYQGTAGCGEIEGGVNNAAGDGLYGGACGGGTPNAADNSGTLKYVRIEYPGIAFQPNNEINGLTLGGVGSGTTIDHVQVSYSGDDSFEWFGGSVNAKHLIAYRGLDDDFDCDFGFNGSIQYAFSVRDPEIADVSGSNGFEIDNNATGTAATPKTRPTFSNVTIVGPTGSVASDYRRAAHIRRNSEPAIFNSILMGSYPVGIFIDGDSCANHATSGKIEVKNTFVAGPTTLLTTTNTVGFDVTSWFNTAAFANSALATSSSMNLQDPFNLDAPNASPTFSSPALGAASFTAARINNTFFDQVSYAGAFSGQEDWTQGWAKFLELNVDGLTETKNVEQYIQQVKLFPTVANDQVTLQLQLTEAANLNVSVYGMNGQYFGQQVDEKAAAGEQTFTLQTMHLPAGFYFVRIQAGNAVKTEKLIVVR
ncbi:MAG: T9SS type A sorting domain-containing protein [Saprospiraceae bacterium]|nr:T9SS type A sorting domain-containing protein [Saprospiraceae bacterium]